MDDLADFLEQVDMIIELGHVGNNQERKALLTSYLPALFAICKHDPPSKF
ncbi:hypothetical protein B0H13DRAFT_2362783 [Mycena leptocephala]|nr:hypothetical protein B0H13DRAFT_2384665 [Mycena leptocephala]KAJ7846784.1 hypothetical protein B0H13DRAFT_2362783 [Mycena leptocephala]